MRNWFSVLAICLPVWLNAQVGVAFLQNNVSCFGNCDGSTTAVGQGGTFPYTFLWSTGSTSASLSGLCAGTYTVTVTDAAQNTGVGSVTIIQPNQLSVEVSTENQICGVAPDGTATAVPTGGMLPYTYAWSNNGTGNQITGLAEGAYTVTVTDFNGCTAVNGSTVFFWNEGIWLMVTPTDLLCFGDSSGTTHASPMSGTPPYTYDWGSAFPNSQDLTDLPPGTYTVTVTDVNGCANTASATIAEPPPLNVVINSVPAACGQAGNATASPSGGTPGYTIAWSNGDTTATASGLPGPLSVTVTDANGCIFTLDTSIPGDTAGLAASIQKLNNAGCLIGGSASASAVGGTGNYLFAWSNGDTTAVVADLAAGTYTVTITDQPSGCTGTATVTIAPVVLDLSVTATADSPATCLTGGSATATASGGTSPYIFVWDGADSTATVSNLSAGPHIVVVTDATGCTASDTVAIVTSPLPSVSANVLNPVTCATGGGAQATASGGIPPYAYAWSNGDTTATAGNLQPGIFTVTATDAGGCTAVAMVTLSAPEHPTVTIGAVVNATCTSPGSASASASGGIPPYTFFWDNGDTTATSVKLTPGQHIVTATDAGGCSATDTVVIGQAPQPNVIASVTGQVTCISSGAASASASGGTAPYNFLWSNGAVTDSISGLSPNTYTVTVTDAAGCTTATSVLLLTPSKPNVSIVGFTNVNCAGPGTATAQATGGTSPYNYLWDNNETTAVATNLAEGLHVLTVTDANGCTGTATVSIGFSNTGGINVGDFVWYDNDQDGFQHPLETGVPDIPVALIQAGPDGQFGTPDDVTVATTATDSMGKYQFECVVPGTYMIAYSGIPAGYEFTLKDKVNNDCKDSDANPNGKTDPFVVTAGQGNNLCIDAGINILCENVMNAGLVCCDQTICEGETPALLYEIMPPAMGSGTLQYLWMQLMQIGAAPPTWVAVPGGTGPSYQPGPLSETTYFMRCVRREGCVTYLETNIITITVLPAGSPGCTQFFSSFEVEALSKATVAVHWTTLPEMTQYLYTVERSGDKTNWTPVTQVMGHEDATAANNYTVMDHTPANGMNYYRIRRLSAAGVESFSDVREVELKISREESLAVYPNPAVDVLRIRNLIAYDADARLQLYATSGRLLYSLKIPAGTLQQFDIPVADLPQGIYLARIRFDDGEVQTIKVSKF